MTSRQTIDVLMVTYNRPIYAERSLRRLLDSGDEAMRVWVWHNGTDAEMLDVVSSMRDHPAGPPFPSLAGEPAHP
ncbi:MAG: hypothetical protein ACYS1E_16385 [Planctomycetota bacterium]|jgi:hypothetical protein